MLSLGVYLLKIKIDKSQDPHKLFCLIRRKWIELTPEEIVRQSAILHCLNRGYPAGRISVERKIEFNNLSRRYDIVVYNKKGEPEILIECKAMHHPIKQAVLDQATAYNHKLSTTILWLTNGHSNMVFEVDKTSVGLKSLKNIPLYSADPYLEEQ